MQAPAGQPAGGKLPKNACQADGCGKDLTHMTFYHQRNRICAIHTKADVFERDGVQMRFCQRCGRSHPLGDFDPGKHSCRAELEKHNARRRKAKAELEAKKRKAAGGDGRWCADAMGSSAAGSDDGRVYASDMQRRTAAVLSGTRWQAPSSLEEGGAPPVPAHGFTGMLQPAFPGPAMLQHDAVAAQAAPLPPLHFEVPPMEELEAVARGSDSDLADDISAWLSRHLSDATCGDAIERPPAPTSGQPVWQSYQPLPPPLPPSLVSAWQPVRPVSSRDMASLLMQPAAVPPAAAVPLSRLPTLPDVVVVGQPVLALRAHQAQPGPRNLPGAPTQEGVLLWSAEDAEQAPAGDAAPWSVISTVSVKLFGCEPSELPPNLRSHLATWFEDNALASLEGYLRPGCLHLTVQALLHAGLPPVAEEAGAAAHLLPPLPGEVCRPAPARATGGCGKCAAAGTKRPAPEARAPAADGPAAVRRIVAAMLASDVSLWRSKTLLVQADGHVGLVHQGQLRQTWSIDSAPSDRAVPAICSTSPSVLLGSRPVALVVSGINLLQDDTELLCRLQGRYLEPLEAQCANCTCRASRSSCSVAASSVAAEQSTSWEASCCGCCLGRVAPAGLPAAASPLQTVRLQLEGGLPQGLMYLDIQKGAYIATRGAQILVVGSPAVESELSNLAATNPVVLRAWMAELGTVAEWLGSRGKVQWRLVERAAARVLFWAVGRGLPATAAMALSVLQQPGSSDKMQDAPPLHDAPFCDGLALLGSIASSVERRAQRIAAALGRGKELAGSDGLSLVHKAVQSGSVATLQAVLGWGSDSGKPWRCDEAGPFGVTPLHLCAVVPDPVLSGQLAGMLMDRCMPGRVAWHTTRTADGLTPADFAQLGSPSSAVDWSAVRTLVCNSVLAPAAPPTAKPLAAGAEPDGGAPRAADALHQEDDWRPATPRRCMCVGDCPCSRRVDGASCCMDSLLADGSACCGARDGKCACCSGNAAAMLLAAPVAGDCCGGAH